MGAQLGGTTQGSTLAERIANAATQSQVFDRLGSRGKQFFDAKSAMDAERRQLDLAALQATQTQQAAAIAARNQKLLQDDQQAAQLELQSNLFGQQTSLQNDDQEHSKSMFDLKKGLEESLVRLRGNESRKGIKLEATLREKLAKTNAEIELENALKRMKQAHIYDIDKLEKGLEKDKQLASYQATLNRISQDSQNAYNAKRQALEIAARKELQLDSQAFEKELRLTLQQNGFDNDAINREVLKVQNSIENAFKEGRCFTCRRTTCNSKIERRK